MAESRELSKKKFTNPIDLAWEYTLAWNSKDYRKVVDLFLPEGIYMGPPIPPETEYNPLNIDEIGEMVKGFMTGFPDMVYTNVSVSTVSNTISYLNYVFAGTHTGKYMVFEPTGRKVWLPGASLLTLKDGLLISALDAYNPIDFINQLSVGEYDVKQFSAMLGFVQPK